MRWTNLRKTGVLLSSLLGCLVSLSCQTAEVFPYKYYGLSIPDYDGTLLGPDVSKDLPFNACQPDDQVKGKCVVLLTDEFTAMRLERSRLKEALKECQAR